MWATPSLSEVVMLELTPISVHFAPIFVQTAPRDAYTPGSRLFHLEL